MLPIPYFDFALKFVNDINRTKGNFIVTDPYPSLIQEYRKKSVQLTLNRLDPNPDKPLADLETARVLHTLDLALEDDIAWPDTCLLLDLVAPKMEVGGKREEWLSYLERGITYAVEMNDLRTEARLAIHLGDVHRHINQLYQSETCFQRSLTISEKNSWSIEQGVALNRLAILALRRSLYAEAERLCELALAVLPEDHIDRANSYYVLGAAKIDGGNAENAIPLLKISCQIWQKSGNKRKYAWGLRNLGHALGFSGQLNEALNCTEKAYWIFSEVGDIHAQASAQMNLGTLKSKLGRYDEAIQLYKDTVVIFQNLCDVLNLARAYGNMGIEYRMLNELVESERVLRKSIELGHKAQHEFTICNSIFELWVTQYSYKDSPKVDYTLNLLLQRLTKLRKDSNTRAMADKFLIDIKDIMETPFNQASP